MNRSRAIAAIVCVLLTAAAAWFAFGRIRASSAAAAGESALKSRDYDLAISHFTEAIRRNPDVATAYVGRARAYLGKKNHQDAIKDCAEAIRLSPDLGDALAIRGSAYYVAGDEARGLKDIEAAVLADPSSKLVWFQHGRICALNQSKREQAIQSLSRAIEIDPEYASAYAVRGEVYSELKRHSEALSDCNQAISLDSANAWAYKTRGDINRKLGKAKEAEADYAQASALDKDLGELIRLQRQLE